MPSPLDGIRYIHAAIMAEADQLDALALSAKTDKEAHAIRDRVSFYEHLLKIHTDAEERHVFPLLDGKLPTSAQTYLFDHKEEKTIIDKVGKLSQPSAGKGPQQPEFAHAMRELRNHLSLHVRKENELIVPLLTELLSIADQGKLAGALMAEVPKEMYPILLPWLMARLTVEDRIGYLSMVKAGAPPPAFASMVGLVRQSLSPSEVAVLAKAIPELAN